MIGDTKRCSRCKEFKPFDCFGKGRATKRRLSSQCKPCANLSRKISRKTVLNRKAHNDKLDRIYKGFDYYKTLKAQSGKCKLCGINSGDIEPKKFHIDHDHACCPGKKSCGKCIRGLLCSNCNTGLGQFRDDINLLYKAINYLQVYQVSRKRPEYYYYNFMFPIDD